MPTRSNPKPIVQLDENNNIIGAGGTSATDDAAFTPGTSSVTPGGALFDDVTPDSVDEGDVGVLRMSANRNLYTTIRDAAGNERGLNVDANGAIAVTVPAPLSTTGAGTVATALRTTLGSDDPAVVALQLMDDWDNAASDGASVSGDVAHDGVDAGEPVKVGFKAYSPDGSTPGTAVAEADRTHGKSDLDGIQYVQTMNPQNFSYHDDDVVAVTTDGTVKAAPGAGFAVFITDIIFSIGVATASSIFLEESTTKILGPYYLEAVAGRGLAIHFTTPKRTTANTAILVTNTGATTFSVDIHGFVAAV